MSMLNTIERNPKQLNKILINKDLINKKLQDYLKAHSNIKKIVFIASGTSYNAAFTTKIFAEDCTHIPVELIYPNIFVNYSNQALLNTDNLYIFISQGGKTKLVYEALEDNKEVLYIVISKQEIVRLKSIINEIDESAYVTMHSVHEVIGKGYKAAKVN